MFMLFIDFFIIQMKKAEAKFKETLPKAQQTKHQHFVISLITSTKIELYSHNQASQQNNYQTSG